MQAKFSKNLLLTFDAYSKWSEVIGMSSITSKKTDAENSHKISESFCASAVTRKDNYWIVADSKIRYV